MNKNKNSSSINEITSRKIKVISLMACIAVIAWHSECGAPIEKRFIRFFATWSVPWFFLVSGFFFVLTIEKNDLWHFMLKKIQTLVIPYVIWCIVGWFFWYPFVSCWLRDVLGLSYSIFPSGNLPMWYIRTLIVFSGGGVIGYELSRRTVSRWFRMACISIGVLGVQFIFKSLHVGISPGSSPVFFLLGCAMAVFKIDLSHGKKDGLAHNLTSLMAFCLAVLCHFFSESHITLNIAIILTIVAIWYLSDYIKESTWIDKLTGITAGVYFIHDPIRRGVDKYFLGTISSGLTPCQMNFYYFSRIIVLFSLIGWVVYVVKQKFPRFAAIIFGRR